MDSLSPGWLWGCICQLFRKPAAGPHLDSAVSSWLQNKATIWRCHWSNGGQASILLPPSRLIGWAGSPHHGVQDVLSNDRAGFHYFGFLQPLLFINSCSSFLEDTEHQHIFQNLLLSHLRSPFTHEENILGRQWDPCIHLLKRGWRNTGCPVVWDAVEHFLRLEAKLAYDLSTASVSTLPFPKYNPCHLSSSDKPTRHVSHVSNLTSAGIRPVLWAWTCLHVLTWSSAYSICQWCFIWYSFI